MIEVTGINLKRFTQQVYRLSKPTDKSRESDPLSDTGMGMVLESRGMKNWHKYVLDMHVVQGRECNMTVFEGNDGRWFINDTWHGHTEEQFDELLSSFNLKRNKAY